MFGPTDAPRRSKNRRVAIAIGVVSALVATTAVVLVALNAGTADESVAQATTTTAAAQSIVGSSDVEPGRIAYVTAAGDVMVAESDGSAAIKVGSEAAVNARGLAPLAWRQPDLDAITYVRRDGALISAPVDGTAPIVHATDAVVPADASDRILSWDSTGTFLIYLAQPVPGRIESRVVDSSTAGEGAEADAPIDPNDVEIRTIGDPYNRKVISQFFSPIDPIIYQATVDPETGKAYTAAVVTPQGGAVFSSNFSVDDATFSPDGRYLFAVSKSLTAVQQLIRVPLRNPTVSDLVFDNERVCSPSMSPDGRLLVFGAGADCEELWRLNSNGTEPTLLATDLLGATFSTGQFTWSRDSKTVSHPLCQGIGTDVNCDGPYLDIAVENGTVTQRATAGNVIRESGPLLRNIKATIEVTGPVTHTATMQVGERSVGEELSSRVGSASRLKAVDANDTARSFEWELVMQDNSDFVAGTVRIIDGGVDITLPFVGRLTPYSLGYARLRGIWTQSDTLPLTAGHIVITLER